MTQSSTQAHTDPNLSWALGGPWATPRIPQNRHSMDPGSIHDRGSPGGDPFGPPGGSLGGIPPRDRGDQVKEGMTGVSGRYDRSTN